MSESPWKKKPKKDNGGLEIKIELREWLIEELGGAANCTVCDLYAGQGEMYKACYGGVKSYLGFEIKEVDHPGKVLRGDNRLLWAKNHKGFNLIDSDAYGTPWVLLHDVMKLKETGIFGLAITDGSFRTLQTGNVHGYTRQIIGYEGLPDNGLITHWRDDIVRWHIQDWQRFGVKVLRAKTGKSIKTKVFYYGFVLEKSSLTNE